MIFTLFILVLASIVGATGNEQPSAYGVDSTVPLVEDGVNYVRTPDRQSVIQDTPAGSTVSISDHLGSSRLLFQPDHSVISYEYGPFGAGAGIRYASHPYDPHQAVYTTPTRHYASGLGRFLSLDPGRQDASPYPYAGNNPIGNWDLGGNIYVPFYMMSGFNLDHELTGSRTSRFAQSVQSALTGNSSLRLVRPAEMFFDLVGDHTPGVRFKVGGSKTIRTPDGARPKAEYHGDTLFWLVGDEGPMETPHDAEEVFRLWRSRAPGTAERIAIIDFSGDKDRSRGIRESLSAAGIDHRLIRAQGITRAQGENLRGKAYITKFVVEGRPMERAEFSSYIEHRIGGHSQQPEETYQHFFGRTDPQSGPGVFGGAGHVTPTNPSRYNRDLLLGMNQALVGMSEESLIPPIFPTTGEN